MSWVKIFIFTLGLLIFGFLGALAADRGTRPLTFGFALMGAVVFTNWENWFDFAFPAWMGLVIGVLGVNYTLEYAVFFSVAALFIYLSLRWPLPGKKEAGHWAACVLSLIWLAAGGILGGVVFQARGRGDRALVEAVGHYWTIQLCVFLPVAIWLLHSFWRGLCLGKERKWIKNRLRGYLYIIVVVLGLLLFLVPFQELWKRVHFIVPPLAAVAGAIALWPGRLRLRGRFYWGPAAVFWVFAVLIPSMNQTPKSSEAEYRLYRWLGENVPDQPGKIFVPWSDGFFAQAVSGLSSELSPERIDFQLPLVYWMPEEESFRFLKAKGINYIMVSSKYFKLLAYNPQTGEYQYFFSPDIMHRPEKLGLTKFSELQKATLFQLLYDPGNLKYYRLLREEWSKRPGREFYRLFELVD